MFMSVLLLLLFTHSGRAAAACGNPRSGAVTDDELWAGLEANMRRHLKAMAAANHWGKEVRRLVKDRRRLVAELWAAGFEAVDIAQATSDLTPADVPRVAARYAATRRGQAEGAEHGTP